MRFEDEQYIRLYKRDTTTWLMLNWQGRCILPLIFRKLDRAGLLDLGEDGYDALAAHIQVPIEVVEEGMKSILRRNALVLREDGLLVAPRFIDAQEAKQSDKARQKSARERARDIAAAAAKGITLREDGDVPPPPSTPLPTTAPLTGDTDIVTPREQTVTPRDAAVTPREQTVTAGHATSHGVTLSSAQLSCAQLSPAELRATPPMGGTVSPVTPRARRAEPSRAEEPYWRSAYAEAVCETLGKPWAFPVQKTSGLRSALIAHCPDLARADDWIRETVPGFVREALEGSSRADPYGPDAFVLWLNALPVAEPPITAPTPAPYAPDEDTPIAVQPITPEQRAADAEFLAELAESSTLRGVREDDRLNAFRPIRIASGGGT